jgi:phosphoglycolate phosphatase-like HAD superfamily hydrolase
MVEEKLRLTENEPQGRIKILGFDMDGTLIDSARQFPLIFGAFMQEEFGVSPEEAGVYFLQTQGTYTHEQILSFLRKVYSERIPSMDELIRMGELVDNRLAACDAEPFPEVETTLQILQDEGYKMFVSSSHQTDVVGRKLRTVSLDKFFPFWIGKNPYAPHLKKGEPHFRAASIFFNKPYGVFINQLAYVGDAPSDILTTLDAGATAIGRTGSRTRDELLGVGISQGIIINVIDDLSVLPSLVKKAL